VHKADLSNGDFVEERDSQLTTAQPKLLTPADGPTDPYLQVHGGADVVIFAGSLLIAGMLLFYFRRRRDLSFRWVFVASAGFVLMAGLGHVLPADSSMAWVRWLSVAADLGGALAAVIAALLLGRALPSALAFPSENALADANTKLQAEVALRESETKFSRVFSTVPEAIAITQLDDGTYVEVNDAYERLMGYRREEVIGRSSLDIGIWPRPQDRQRMLKEIASGNRVRDLDVELRRKDGDVRLAEMSAERIDIGGRACLVTSARDVTEQRRVQEALRNSEEKFATIFRICPESVSISTLEDGVYVDVNQAYERVFGYLREQVIGRSALDLGIWVDGLERQELVRRIQRQRRVEDFEARIRRADGEIRITHMSADAVELYGDRCLIIVLRDVTRQKEQDDQLRLAARVFESTAEAIVITDAGERIVAVNSAFTELTGYSEEEVRGREPSVLQSGRHDNRFYDEMWGSLNRTGRWRGELWNRSKDGEVRPYLTTITALRDERGAVLNYVGVMRDISSIKQSQQQLEYLANYDALTGLGNRNLFYTRLSIGIERAARHHRGLAVVFIDLDNFKIINDTLGHDVGDVLLSEAARRLKACVRQEDTVCRLGGDEFTVYVEDFNDPESLVGTAQRLAQTISEPYHISNQDIFVTASVGISVYPNDGTTMSELIKNADTAMYKVKEQGKNGFQFFREDMNARAFERLVFVTGLRRALERQEFRVVYQPQIDLAGGNACGAECLLRWDHPDMGEVSPGAFIPVAEETGLIVPIGEWVFAQVCRQLRDWGGLPSPGRISVNVSARQFRQPELIDVIQRTVRETGVNPTALGIEITESALMDDPEAAAATLLRLKEMGLTISIDDFGTGYSSLSYLKRFPIDSLKIDRGFVRDIATDPDDAAIVTAIITMAQSLKIDVIAEGVETEEQLNFLRNRGCDAAQGYYFSRPVPAEQVRQWLFSALV